MFNYSNPFLTPVGGSRRQFTRPPPMLMQPPPQAAQPEQDQYDFSGWADRLDRIESGIGSLTKQFNSFQAPGEVDPEYQGNAAPEPLEQTANAPEPLPLEPTSMADWMKGYEFDLAPMMPQFQQDPNQAGGFNTQFGQHHEDWRNNPENMAWQQREKERGDLSQGTWDAITGGQRMDSNAQHTVIPYIRGGGGGYEDYLSQNEKMKIGMGLGGGQQQLSRMAPPDPTKMMGGENWKPIGQEEYERQQDLWGSHMDYGAFSQAAFNQLGTAGNDISRYKQGSNPIFGHAYEAWQKFNESQPGGPYTTPDATRDPFGQLDFSGVRPQIQGALQGPLQQQIQQGLGSLAA